jgi:hypothetical protein
MGVSTYMPVQVLRFYDSGRAVTGSADGEKVLISGPTSTLRPGLTSLASSDSASGRDYRLLPQR